MSTDLHRPIDDHTVAAWAVDAADFPTGSTVDDVLRFCLRYAILAPSTHNTQPWWFHLDGSSVTIGLDTARGLPVVDPNDRESLLSIGAALFNLRVALAHFDFATAVSLWPDPVDPEACARLTVTAMQGGDHTLNTLFPGITRRHTSRHAFTDQPPADALLTQLASDAETEGSSLHVVQDYPTRHALAELISRADTTQMDDRSFRRELAAWSRTEHSHRSDGIRGYVADVGELMAHTGPLVVRTFDVGLGRAARDVELATRSPVLAVLCTRTDDRTAWLSAGQSLARVLLHATQAGLCVGFLDQPIEIDRLRSEVARRVACTGHPQVLLRLGYGPAAAPQSRRPVHDVLSQR